MPLRQLVGSNKPATPVRKVEIHKAPTKGASKLKKRPQNLQIPTNQLGHKMSGTLQGFECQRCCERRVMKGGIARYRYINRESWHHGSKING